MALTSSMNALAEERDLPAWSSWRNGRPAGYFDLPLTREAVDFYKEQGFLVIENAFSEAEIEKLRSETVAICRGERGDVGGLPAFSPTDSDQEVIARVLCVHFPHKISTPMLDAVTHPAMQETLAGIIGPNVKCMQSMLFVKAAGKPGQAWHQDEIYIPTRDRSLTGGWIAMDDATVENGCLWVIPGSHREGVLYLQEWHNDKRFDCAWEARRFPWSNDDAVPVEVKAGSIVFFNGYLLHRSLPNYAKGGFRRSLVNHYMSAESFLPWYGFEPGQAVSTADYRDILMVCGTDPYAFKGIENRAGVHVRPSGEGGCGYTERNEEAAAAEEAPTADKQF